jgi:hypothetical protein
LQHNSGHIVLQQQRAADFCSSTRHELQAASDMYPHLCKNGNVTICHFCRKSTTQGSKSTQNLVKVHSATAVVSGGGKTQERYSQIQHGDNDDEKQ